MVLRCLGRFEKWWLSQPGFRQVVVDAWNSVSSDISSIENWMLKTRVPRKKTKGWSINLEVAIKKKKIALLMDLDMLDVSSETHNLSPGDFARMGFCNGSTAERPLTGEGGVV